ncbi:MAG: urease accessory protein [Moraxellaceae bacterium]|nr:MAG: urease accessory protein [Moraxellaceae bacterium]
MRFLLLALLGVSSCAMAHPGHDQFFHSSLLAGLIHPLTGLDHLTMGLGLGLLMARTFKQTRFVGFGLLLLSLVGGFAIGMQHIFADQFAEYGIMASLLVLSVALWQRSNTVFLSMITVLGVFHGMAHGNELASDVNPVWFMLGMLVSLSSLYLAGTMAARFFKQHIRLGERMAAVLAGVVALLGLA